MPRHKHVYPNTWHCLLFICLCYTCTSHSSYNICLYSFSPAIELVVEPPEESSNGDQQTLCSWVSLSLFPSLSLSLHLLSLILFSLPPSLPHSLSLSIPPSYPLSLTCTYNLIFWALLYIFVHVLQAYINEWESYPYGQEPYSSPQPAEPAREPQPGKHSSRTSRRGSH